MNCLLCGFHAHFDLKRNNQYYNNKCNHDTITINLMRQKKVIPQSIFRMP